MGKNLEKYPEEWRPVLAALLEVLDEYAPNSFDLYKVVKVDGAVQIWMNVPWSGDVILSSHKLAERILTKIEEER